MTGAKLKVVFQADDRTELRLGGTMHAPVWTMPAVSTETSRAQGMQLAQAAGPDFIRAADLLGVSVHTLRAIADGYARIEPFDEAIALLKG